MEIKWKRKTNDFRNDKNNRISNLRPLNKLKTSGRPLEV